MDTYADGVMLSNKGLREQYIVILHDQCMTPRFDPFDHPFRWSETRQQGRWINSSFMIVPCTPKRTKRHRMHALHHR